MLVKPFKELNKLDFHSPPFWEDLSKNMLLELKYYLNTVTSDRKLRTIEYIYIF